MRGGRDEERARSAPAGGGAGVVLEQQRHKKNVHVGSCLSFVTPTLIFTFFFSFLSLLFVILIRNYKITQYLHSVVFIPQFCLFFSLQCLFSLAFRALHIFIARGWGHWQTPEMTSE
jgi:hypothetical protein